MAIIEIVFEAKCKHCVYFNSERKVKKDGSLSSRNRYYCGIPNESGRGYDLTMKDKVCDKWGLL